MNSALGWIGELVRWFANWIPQIYHVKSTEKAVRFVRSRAYLVKPGLHVFWPIMTQVDIYPVVRQVMELPLQTVVAKDEECPTGSRPVSVGGVITYHIADLYAFLAENYDAAISIKEAAQAGIRKAVLAESVQSINRGRAEIDNRLAREVQKMVAAFGVAIESARLTTFAPTSPISLMSDGSTPLGKISISPEG